MKNIFLIYILLLLLPLSAISQSLCPPNGISTNHDNPINLSNPSMENDFFDWRVQDFTDYYDPTYINVAEPFFSSTNPYWSSEDYLGYLSGWDPNGGDELEIDYSPIEGWELLARGFGKFIDGSINVDFYNPYFLMYNKYTGMMRLLFSIPSVAITGPFQSVEVTMTFNDEKITALMSNVGTTTSSGISQPLDQKTETTLIIGYAQMVEPGWSHVEFPTAFDPCTCQDFSSVKFDFRNISTSSIELTGLMIGQSTPISLFTNSNELDDENRLVNVLENGLDPEVGIETFKSIDKWVDAAKNAQANPQTLLNNIITIMDKFGGLFSVAAGAISGFESLRKTLKLPNVDAAEWDKVQDFGKAAKTIAGINKSATSALKKFKSTSSVQIYPAVIEAELALSGTLTTTSKVERATFVIDTPGTSPSTNTNEFGTTEFPAYPFYNEILGRFALLKTPKIYIEKEGFFHNSEENNDPYVYSADYRVKLDESSIEYVFNPTLNLDHENTSLWATIVVKSKEDISEAFSNFFEPTHMTSEGFSQTSDFTLLDCLGGFVGIHHYRKESLTPLPQNDPLLFLGNEDEYFLQIHIDYVFNELDRNGNQNRAMQLLTYPLEVVESSTPLVNELFNATVGNLILTGGTFSENISAIGSITITGDIFAEPGTEIIITGYEIMVDPGVFIGPNVFLIPGIPTGCGTTLASSSIDLTSYCSNGTYQGNQSLVSNTPETSLSVQNPSNDEISKIKLGSANLETKVYPNPSMDGLFNLAILSSELEQDISISISDATGREVYQSKKSILQYDEFQIDLSSQSKGFYFIQITDDFGNRFFEKIIIE